MDIPSALTFERKIEHLQDIKTKLSAAQMYLLDIVENYEEFLLKYSVKHALDKILDMVEIGRAAMKRIDEKIEKFEKGKY